MLKTDLKSLLENVDIEFMRCLVLFWLFLFSSVLYGNETQLVYFGGGGESLDKDTTNFDYGFQSFAAYANTKKLKADYYFTKKHKQSLKWAEDAIGRTPNEFTSENWTAKVANLTKQIESGEISKDDKIMLVIESHGNDSSGIFQVATVNGMVAPKKELETLIKTAEARDVKISLIAANCASGNLISLASPKTCVIATAQPGQYGFTSDGHYLFNNFKNSTNLEDAFLKTRDEIKILETPSQPILSSPAGLKAQQTLKALFPYLSKRAVDHPGTDLCQYPAKGSLKQIESDINAVKRSTEIFGYKLTLKNNDAEKLEDELQKYFKAAQEHHRLVNSKEQSEIRCFNTPVPFFDAVGMGGNNINLGFEMDIEFTNTVAVQRHLSCVTSLSEVSTQLRYHHERLGEAISENAPIEFQNKIKDSIQHLTKLSTDVGLQENSRRISGGRYTIKNWLEIMLESRKKIVRFEREIYNQLYKKYSEELKDQPNPCRDFSL